MLRGRQRLDHLINGPKALFGRVNKRKDVEKIGMKNCRKLKDFEKKMPWLLGLFENGNMLREIESNGKESARKA